MTQNIYFTADLHFGHKNILTLANRRFKSIEDLPIVYPSPIIIPL